MATIKVTDVTLATHLSDHVMAPAGGVVQGGLALDVGDVDHGAVCEEDLRGSAAVVPAGHVEGPELILTTFDVHI